MNRRQTKKAWSLCVARWEGQHKEFRLMLWPERVRRSFVRSKFHPGLSRAELRVRQFPSVDAARCNESDPYRPLRKT